jgi:16S rRNA (adenine1518-N6/adenine1519-N6)-dimethyltransferase
VIAEHNLRAEKKLGQNFLLDLNLTDKIAKSAAIEPGDHVFEVGPGPGGLTRSLLKTNAGKVTAIEFDQRAIAALAELKDACNDRLNIIHADALDMDLQSIEGPGARVIVSNLPYNIATALLIRWLSWLRADQAALKSMTLMFQKEVAQRIVAKPDSKAYGRLSVISQWLCETRILFDVPRSAFTPPPKVTSSIVKLIPRQLPQGAPSFSTVEQLTAMAFNQRRKMIRSSLGTYAKQLEELGFDTTKRAENLTPEDYIKLAQAINSKDHL